MLDSICQGNRNLAVEGAIASINRSKVSKDLEKSGKGG